MAAVDKLGGRHRDAVPAGRARYRLAYCETKKCRGFATIEFLCNSNTARKDAKKKLAEETLPSTPSNQTAEKDFSDKEVKVHFQKPRKTVMSPHESVMRECGRVNAADCPGEWEQVFGTADPGITSQYRKEHIEACYKSVMYTEKYCAATASGMDYAELYDIYRDKKKFDDIQTDIMRKVSDAEGAAYERRMEAQAPPKTKKKSAAQPSGDGKVALYFCGGVTWLTKEAYNRRCQWKEPNPTRIWAERELVPASAY